VAERDYRKFLKEDDRLNIRLIPRTVYVEMVKRHRNNPAVIDKVFGDLFWLWDLNALATKASDEGREATRGELAEEILSEMSDSDWWTTIEAFEQHLMKHFHENPLEWAEFLDPVYDMQEQAGWVRQQ
jgi:hypothetical protein